MLKHVRQKPKLNPQQLGLMALKESLNKPIKSQKIKIPTSSKEKEFSKSNHQQVGLMALKNTLNKETNIEQSKDDVDKQIKNDHLKDGLNKQTKNVHLSFDLHESDTDSGILSVRSSIISRDDDEKLDISITKDTRISSKGLNDIVGAEMTQDTKVQSNEIIKDTQDTKVSSKGITGIAGALNQLQNDLLNMALYLDHPCQCSELSCECDKPRNSVTKKESFRESQKTLIKKESFRESKKSLIKKESFRESSNFVTEKYFELSSYDDELEDLLSEDDDDDSIDPEDLLPESGKPMDEWSLGNIGLQKTMPQYGSPTGAKGTMFNLSFVTKGRKFSGDKK